MKLDSIVFLLQAMSSLGISLEYVGNGGDIFPLGECQGDCDYDEECAGDLRCFQREAGEAVPGCDGNWGDSASFCYSGTESFLTNRNDADKPFGECEGDCDSDEDCAGELNCYERSSGDTSPIPGCIGVPVGDRDYCYAGPPLLKWQGDAYKPFGKCTGDCDSDDDCAGTLRCFHRNSGDPEVLPGEFVPGCLGVPSGSTDYCYDGPSVLQWQGDANKPFGSCTGDCDSDDDCEGTLRCYHRNSDDTEPIPGCLGVPSGGTDYCYDGPPVLRSLPDTQKPFEECVGDCDSDADCQGDLICFQRDNADVPGCLGNPSFKRDYCIQQVPNYLTERGNNGSPAENFPLGECEGDCDSDSECAEGLECFQRNGLEPVPGCDGLGDSSTDYCYNPDPTNQPTVSAAPTADTASPSAQPSISSAPSIEPTAAPTAHPTTVTDAPTDSNAPTLPKQYEYTGTNEGKNLEVEQRDRPCGNINGPAPEEDLSDVVIQFLVIGDTPYDGSATACLDSTNQEQKPCTDWDCGSPALGNTCLYTGSEYTCLKEDIIPHMKTLNNRAAFAAHIGDMLKGSGGNSMRCTPAALGVRKDLFNELQTHMDFVVVPGDNEWNECNGFSLTSNDDPAKGLWRQLFAESGSPFHDFSRNFPTYGSSSSPVKPTLERQANNPENFYFQYEFDGEVVGFFGLTEMNVNFADTWNGEEAQNVALVESKLGMGAGQNPVCQIDSIVIFSQTSVSDAVRAVLDDFFNACGSERPVANFIGDIHPYTHCSNTNENDNILKVVVEAFKAAPLMVSIVMDPDTGKHYFHMESTSTTTIYGQCANFATS